MLLNCKTTYQHDSAPTSRAPRRRNKLRPLSVAFLVTKFPLLSQTFILNQATGLLDRGHEVTILSLAEPPNGPAIHHPAVSEYGLLDRTTYLPRTPRGLLDRFLQFVPTMLRTGGRGWPLLLRSMNVARYGHEAMSLRNFFRAAPYLNCGKFDVVHCQFGPLGLAALSLRDLGVLDAPIVTSFRGYDASRYVQDHGEHVYRPLFADGDGFLPNCDFFSRRLIDLGCDASKIEILRSGINCRRFSPFRRDLSARATINISSTGRLVEKKGLIYAIQAIEIVRRAHPSIRYKIVGEGPLRPQLEHEIASRGLTNTVELVGEMDQEDVVQVLGQTDIFLAPSVKATDGDEDAPVNTLKEAMAMGLPVVATSHGGIVELVDDGVSGYLAPERSPQALADKLLKLIDERQWWPQMGGAGRQRVLAEYDIEPLNDRLVEIYRQAIARRGSAERSRNLRYEPRPAATVHHWSKIA